MQGNTNKKVGNHFEIDFCIDLFKHGWWVYNCPQNAYGQPADVIAVKGSTVLLVDCKVCTKQGFSFIRMEENQRNAMTMFENRTNYLPMFVFKLPEHDVYGIHWCTLKQLEDEGVRFLRNEEIRKYGIPLDEICRSSL